MAFTSFRSRDSFLAEIQQANSKMKELLERIKIALSEEGFPLRKDTYHFVTRVLKPTNRVERTLFSLMFQTAYRTELLSAGSAYLSVRFANHFMESLLQHQDLLNRNEVDLVREFEAAMGRYNEMVTGLSTPLQEDVLGREIDRVCEDALLAKAVKEALLISGLEGKIHIEDGILSNYVVEQKSGYSFKSVRPFKFMIPKNGVWDVKNAKVMIVDGIIERVSEIDKILIGAMETKIPLLLISHGFSEEVISTIKVNVDAEKFNIMPVRLTTELDSLNVANDIAVVSGADIISTLKGEMVVFTEFDSLPFVEQIRVTQSELNIEHAKTRGAVSQHLRMLLEKRQGQHQIEDLSDLIDKRIQTLISAAVTLRLPNMSASQRDTTKVKVDIVLRNAKTLLNYGRVDVNKACAQMKLGAKPTTELEGIVQDALLKLAQENPEPLPTLSAYAAPFFMGKTILALLTSNGLIEITGFPKALPPSQPEEPSSP